MTEPGPLQVLGDEAQPTAAATRLAQAILQGALSGAEAVEAIADMFLPHPRVDAVTVALTTYEPESKDGWIELGQRAWLREWVSPGSLVSVVPDGDAGPEAALTMPWMSPRTREGVVVITDVELLPPEAAQDRREMLACGVRSLVSSSQVNDGVMFGSISLLSATGGPWPDGDIADLTLLAAALRSRLQVLATRHSLADAIARGDQASAVQQQFFAATGHELRTPISAILGYAEVLQSDAEDLAGVTDPEQLARFVAGVHRDTGIIVGAGEQLLAIVEELLSTARVLGDAPREPVVVAEAVQDVVHWVRTPAATAQVDVTASVPADLAVLGTPAGVRQVLTNLVGNAVAHNRAGGRVTVSATPTQGEAGEPRIRISVKDTGPGLTPRQLSQVFEPFVRFAEPGVRGTGLGLSLSRAVAERDGGLLGVESRSGEGSTFWLDLPAATGG
ncbi:Histidine protein kinase DivJ [Nocardioides dokdonensis FR1436]|uniref:histidine kinase n=1 Tax=Nocardioides dokdonensis FR1436 TaxID=1300347 RepID=A0A1A9GMC9_9ACTN|nr:HAMP domain-containing sensor histidine kinase [Nocardioides dokdonensis]ANH38773.1 Histidine protein kinase DivJ [Nocardioides dokdonensis FR1436]